MKTRTSLILSLILSLIALPLCANYTVVDLGLPDGMVGAQALDINNMGEVVGVAFESFYVASAKPFYWRGDTGFRLLALPTGAAAGVAWAINDQGLIAGHVESPATQAVVWKNGVPVEAGPPGSKALAVNNTGQVVSGYYGANGYNAYTWNEFTGVTDLGIRGGAAFGINDAGTVCITMIYAPPYTSFTQDRFGVQTLIWGPNGEYARALAINSSGECAGYLNTWQAFFWSPLAGASVIGKLPGDYWGQAYGINNRSQVIGGSWGRRARAWTWTPVAGIQALPDVLSDTPYSFARGIDDLGRIVGASRGEDGLLHAVRWDP